MSTIEITLPEYYSWVLLMALILCVQCFMVGLITVLNKRKELFNKEFMEKNFKEIHSKEIGSDLPGNGFPDNGNGYYSKKISYKDWYDFNNL